MPRTLLVLPLALLLPATALAKPHVGDNFLGGRVVARNQFYVTSGYPDTTMGFRLKAGKKFEFIPNFGFEYARFGHGQFFTSLGTHVALDMRWQVLTAGDVSGAITLSLPFLLGIEPHGRHDPTDLAVGFGVLHPGFAVTWAVADVVDLDFGLRFENDLWFSRGEVYFSGSVPVRFGVETEVVDHLAIGFFFEGGPAFTIEGRNFDHFDHFDDFRGVRSRLRGGFGLAWSF